MSYFKFSDNKIKTSSVDEVFSIFLDINDSTDEMQIYDNIIRAIKQYYNLQDFKEEHTDLLEQIIDKIFKEPNVPHIIKQPKKTPEIKQRDNKFKQKYRL
jgi:hypothetical protein